MSKKVGRNDPCHCGSGKKYKVCHGRSAAGGSNRWMLIGGVVGVVALGYFVNKILTSDGQNNPPPGKVWSPEHSHWHDATATSTPCLLLCLLLSFLNLLHHLQNQPQNHPVLHLQGRFGHQITDTGTTPQ